MKIRIKETGKLLEDVKFIDTTLHKITIQYLDDGVLRECSIKNLSDIEEVKDYEEPKEYWYIDPMVCGIYCTKIKKDGDLYGFNKEIGNYFETEEEAEDAVKKLQAWKRLKDKGFSFNDWNWKTQCIAYNLDYTDITEEQIEEAEKDLDLLFSEVKNEEISHKRVRGIAL